MKGGLPPPDPLLREEDYLPLTPSFERRGSENKGGGVKTAVLVITVPLLAKEGLGEVDYDPCTAKDGE